MTEVLSHEQALERLLDLHGRAADSRGHFVRVRAPFGFGRTRLVRELADRVTGGGHVTLSASACQTERELSFGVLSQLLTAVPPDARERATALLDQAIQVTAAHHDGVDAAVLHSLGGFFLDLARQRPALIIVDDLPDGDLLSTSCLSYVARRLTATRILLVVTEPATAGDGPMPEGRILRLAPLTGSDLQRRLDTAPMRGSVGQLLRLGGGNPTVLAGLLQDLSAAPADEGPAGGWPVGEGYQRAVLHCLHRAGPAALAVGRAVAAGLPTELVPVAVGLTAAETRDALEALTAAELVTADRFRHPAASTAIVADTPAETLSAINRRAAAAAWERGTASEVVARFLLAAGWAGEPWTVAALEDAARRTTEGGSERAVGYLRLALKGCTDAAQRQALMGQVLLRETRVDPARSRDILVRLRTAVQAGEPLSVEAIRALLWHGYAEDVRPALAVAPDPVRGLRGTYPGLVGVHEPADALGLALTGAAAPAVEMADGVLRGHQLNEANVDTLVDAVYALLYAGSTEHAATWCELLLSESRSAEAPAWQARFAALRAEVAIRVGDLNTTVACAQQALRNLSAEGWGVTIAAPVAALGYALTAMRRHDEVARLLERPVPAGVFETRYGLLHLQAVGRHELATQQPVAALRRFEQCGRTMALWSLDTPRLVPWRVEAAHALLALGRPEEATAHARAQLRLPLNGPRSNGLALRLLAHTAPVRQRVKLLHRAAEQLLAAGDRYELANTFEALTGALAAVGDARGAGMARRRARSLATACGAPVDQRHRPSRVSRTVDAGDDDGQGSAISAAEHRVVALAVAGYTNREIADHLFLTLSTVEQHLTRVYRKLKVSGRGQLPNVLDRAPRDLR
jgi:DNA-binding CsgD family transcriptional regulator/tetratricopeptide (TPR) repeat protein